MNRTDAVWAVGRLTIGTAVKLVAPQTPYYSTLTFRFDGDRLLFDSEYNVSFGPTKLQQLEGKAAGKR